MKAVSSDRYASSSPSKYGNCDQKQNDYTHCYFASCPFPFIGFDKQDISNDIDDQTYCPGESTHKEKLNAESYTA